MKKETIIKRYIEKNTFPRKELCPIILQRWRTPSGFIYWNSERNIRTDYPPYNKYNENILSYKTVSPRKTYTSFYMRYDEKNEMLEISLINCDGNRGKDSVEKIWEYDNEHRYFLFREDFEPYMYKDNKVVLGFPESNGRYYNKFFINNFLNLNFFMASKSIDEWKKFVNKTTYVYNGNAYDIKYAYNVISSYKQMVERKIKRNSLLDFELKPLLVNEESIIFEKINENSGVFRYFKLLKKTNTCEEILRVFIRKGIPTVLCRHYYGWDRNNIDDSTEWSVTSDYPNRFITRYRDDNSYKMKSCFGDVFEIKNIEESYTLDSIKWIKEVISDKPLQEEIGLSVLDYIVSMLRHPIIEKLYKAGYKNLVKYLYSDGLIGASCRNLFDLEKEPKSIKEIKLNKYVLSTLDNLIDTQHIIDFNYRRDNLYAISFFNKIFSRETLVHLTENDVKYWITLMHCFGNKIPVFYTENAANVPCYLRYFTKNGRNCISDNDKKLISKIRNIAKNSAYPDQVERMVSSVVSLYKDIHRTYFSLHNKPDIDFVNAINNYDDLQRIHDNLINLLNIEREEERARYDEYQKAELKKQNEKFEELQKERKELYNYEDDKYIIRVPENLGEITQEGISLGHCVGGYVREHASGQTTILFLREKANKDTPFYTIEVRNNNVIQIHGKRNKWLGNDPKAIPSVYKWLKEKKFGYSKDMLLNLGTGYSPAKECLSEEVLAL